MKDTEKTKEQLIEEIKKLRSRVSELEVLEKTQEQEEHEMEIRRENLDLSWAGNLGRWSWDYATGEVVFNDRKIMALGYEPGEIKPKVYDFTDMIHPEDYEPVMENMRQHLSGKSPVYEVEYRIKTKNGGYKWFYDRGKVVERLEDGTPVRIVGIVFDITERKLSEAALKESEERLRQLNNAKDKFFSIIAHDLKNPFTILLNYSKELFESFEILTEEEIMELLYYIKHSSEQTYSLLENLLEWARSQLGSVKFNPALADLFEFGFNTIFQQKNAAEKKGIELINKIPEELYVIVDKNMIMTVFRNLVSNAVKFCNEGGRIIIDAAIKDKVIEVSIIDNGVGMEDKIKENLFRIDQTVSMPGTNKEKGTGLGLIICKEFVEKHTNEHGAGKIWVESEPGEGSSFYFTLPQKPE